LGALEYAFNLRLTALTATLHSNSSHWNRERLFAPIASFSAFESRVNVIPEEKDRADVFEIFIEAYLATRVIAQSRKPTG
jgi:hypothetical protein